MFLDNINFTLPAATKLDTQEKIIDNKHGLRREILWEPRFHLAIE